jgi:CHAT domain-containing protein
VLYEDYALDPHMAVARLALAKGLSSRCQAEVEHDLALLGPLPETADEARKIAADFPGARFVLGAQCTDTDFLSNPDTANADFIMLATYGVLGVSSCFAELALLTSLGANGDGLIGASQLLDRDLKALLVMLSACEIAAGGRIGEASGGLGDGGDALGGLARAFIYTGVRNVLVTQWKVDAAASSAEMAAFVGGGNRHWVNLGQALAMAQRTLFDQAETGHPFYSAAFIVLGDGQRRLTSSSEASGTTGA